MSESRYNPCAACLQLFCPRLLCEIRVKYGWRQEERERLVKQRRLELAERARRKERG